MTPRMFLVPIQEGSVSIPCGEFSKFSKGSEDPAGRGFGDEVG